MKKQNNTPTLRFSEFKGEWEKKKLGEVAENISSGKSNTRNLEGSFPLYGSTGIIGYSDTYEYEGNKILVARVGANAGSLYKVSGKYSVTDNTLIVNLLELVDESFIYYILIKINLNKLVFGSGQPLITGGILKNLSLNFPTLPEQQKIASFLSLVDKKIAQFNKKKKIWQQYKKSVMQKLFAQEIRFKDENGNNFEDLESKTLGEVAEVKKGEQLNKEELTEKGLYPCINGGISPSGFTEKYNSNENTITISEGGASCGFINYLTTKFWAGGHCYKIILINKIDKNYLYQLLKFNEKKVMNLRVGSGLPDIQMKDIKNFELIISHSLAEQTKIANFLSILDQRINLCSKEITLTETFKKGLLQQLFC